jgi:FixJ family two-component response regulator
MVKKASVVYVIEDDESVRRVLARLLRSAKEMCQGPMVGAGFRSQRINTSERRN